ncbi:MAG TPA: DUF2924 domain-containing protein [Candidatus Omnitrophota bacterium]|nr:DUF2924 domain-containing protein [Candidatus Omnitrophota bacterium]
MGDIAGQIGALKTSGAAQLSALYRQFFGDKGARGKRVFMIRQLAYGIQEQAGGGLSPATKERVQELIRIYDPINKTAIRSNSGKTNAGRDIRLPMPGSFIIKNYKGKRLEVKVLEEGFEYEGQFYENLSHIAQAVTGAHWNGYKFFGVKNNGRKWCS